MTQIGRIITEKKIRINPQNPCHQRSKKRNTNDADRTDSRREKNSYKSVKISAQGTSPDLEGIAAY